MEVNYLIELMIRNREVFLNLFTGLSSEAGLWKPYPEKWCMLEVLCHLIDEEKEDFRARVKKTLEDPEAPFTPIDPQKWVVERDYINQDYNKKLKEFMQERDKSIIWMQSLENPKWDNESIHAIAGPISAKKFLVNWIAHDFLHIKQCSLLKYGYLKHYSGMDISYAGKEPVF